MSAANEIVKALQADTGVGGAATLLTGGIYLVADLPRNGISRKDTPGAYNNANGLLKPFAQVRERSEAPWTTIKDAKRGYRPTRTVVDITFENDGDSGYAAIKAARERARELIDMKFIGPYRFEWINTLKDQRDQNLNNAALERISFRASGRVISS